ncbi:hypothetical protein NJB1907Z4_C31870 [Mycobacterium pseudoshottsii]|uniref:Uncharacterized protein n=1 Tax=Mycobacterium pseudoshottsii TaxID=265949 RepID=A0A9N7LTY0_9MYCO|nr:hypothetical protein NJB1907Z4_C31870 [Mycobacterium pseudoshottsii]
MYGPDPLGHGRCGRKPDPIMEAESYGGLASSIIGPYVRRTPIDPSVRTRSGVHVVRDYRKKLGEVPNTDTMCCGSLHNANYDTHISRAGPATRRWLV